MEKPNIQYNNIKRYIDEGSNPSLHSNQEERKILHIRKNNSKKDISTINKDQLPFKIGQLIQYKPTKYYNKNIIGNTFIGTIISFYKPETFNNALPLVQWHTTDQEALEALPKMIMPIGNTIKNIEILSNIFI